MSNKLLYMIKKNGKYQITCVFIGLCKSLIDGTKTLIEIVVTLINDVLWNLIEIVVTSINDVLWNLSKKSYSEQVLKQLLL